MLNCSDFRIPGSSLAVVIPILNLFRCNTGWPTCWHSYHFVHHIFLKTLLPFIVISCHNCPYHLAVNAKITMIFHKITKNRGKIFTYLNERNLFRHSRHEMKKQISAFLKPDHL
jgi:hypothetical protein